MMKPNQTSSKDDSNHTSYFHGFDTLLSFFGAKNEESSSTVPFVDAKDNKPSDYSDDKPEHQFDELISDKRISSFELELAKTTLTDDQVKKMAEQSINTNNPQIFNSLAEHFPNTLTPEVTQKEFFENKPTNSFIYNLFSKDSKTLAPSIQSTPVFVAENKKEFDSYLKTAKETTSDKENYFILQNGDKYTGETTVGKLSQINGRSNIEYDRKISDVSFKRESSFRK